MVQRTTNNTKGQPPVTEPPANSTLTQDQPEPANNQLRQRITLALVITAAVTLLTAALAVALHNPKLTPDQLAQQWVQSNVDSTGEIIAGWLTANTEILRELGGEYIEDRIHDLIKWEHTPATHLGEGIYQATAISSITLTIPTVPGNVRAQLPWDLTIDHPQQTVAAKPDWPSASLILPKALDSQKISETVEQAKDAINKNAPKIKEAINKKGPELANQAESIMDKFK